MPAQDWGPRAGGPAVEPPAPPGGRSGCLTAFMIGIVLVGILVAPSAPEGGSVLILGGGTYLAVVWSRPARERRREAARRARMATETQDWLAQRPGAVAARAADPLAAVGALTAQAGGGVFLGLSPDYREWVTAEPQQAVLVLGPPRAGKTSALIVPAIVAARGPVVSTSTKLDVLEATARARSTLGRVWLFDPSGTDALPAGVLPLHWSPVRSARTWDGARAIADAMVGASSAGQGVENASYWTESAKMLLAPLLHAAAIEGATIGEVRRWVARGWLEDAGRILDGAGADAAGDDLASIAGTEERERSSIFSTARIVLTAYGSDAAAARSRVQNFDAARFVRSADTVYITAPSHLQNVLAPLVAGLLEEIRDAAYAAARVPAGPEQPARPPVLWALDEVANIAPLRKLPAIVSEAGGQGLQVMACFQDLSQARERWGAAADGFLTLFGTKVIFPGIGDKRTLEALSTLVGDWDRPFIALNHSTGQSRQFGLPLGAQLGRSRTTALEYSTKREALLSASEIANVPEGCALTVRAHRWGIVETTPYFRAEPWPAALAAAPRRVLWHGGTDELPQRYGVPERAVTPAIEAGE